MSKKVIFLMGAPTSQTLRWDEDTLLNVPIFPFHSPDTQDEGHWTSPPSSYPVKWRLLQDIDIAEVPCEKIGLDSTTGAHFLTTEDLTTASGVSTTGLEDSALSKFYNHSFAIHETSEISTPGARLGESMRESGIWTDSTGTSMTTSNEEEAPGSGLPMSIQGHITDLRDIPNSTYLNGIVPQTMTVNLIVGVITIRPPRRIVTRQWKKELDLVEMVVGDDTRSGFGVTFWLSPTDEEDEIGKSLATLRPRDIVLLRMVGLSSFRERVYGQSLRRGITKVDLLHRQRVDVTDAGGMYSARMLRGIQQKHTAKNDDPPLLMLLKVSKVREWIKQFVGTRPDPAGGGARGDSAKRGPIKTTILPPDSQDGL